MDFQQGEFVVLLLHYVGTLYFVFHVDLLLAILIHHSAIKANSETSILSNIHKKVVTDSLFVIMVTVEKR